MSASHNILSIGRRRALALGAAAFAASCARRGSGGGSAPADPHSVRIVSTAATFTMTIQQLMRDKGYLAEQGLRPTFLYVADGTKIVSALIGGDADICSGSGFSQVLPYIERGGKLKVLAGAEVLLLHLLFSARPEIKSLKDLEGRTIGVGQIGALLHSMTVALLRKNNVDPAKVKFVNVGSSTDVFRAVVAKTVDAGPSEIDFEVEAPKYGIHVVDGGRYWEGLPEYTNQASYAAESTISQRRDVLVRTLAAYAKLYRFISSPQSRDAYLAARSTALGKNQGTQALAEWQFLQKNQTFAVDLLLSEERVRYMQALNVSLGLQREIVPYDQVADMSLAQDALKLVGKA